MKVWHRNFTIHVFLQVRQCEGVSLQLLISPTHLSHEIHVQNVLLFDAFYNKSSLIKSCLLILIDYLKCEMPKYQM